MSVWIVMCGARGGGGWIVGVFASKDLALDTAHKAQSPCGPWRLECGTSQSWEWVSGCDWLTVREHFVCESTGGVAA